MQRHRLDQAMQQLFQLRDLFAHRALGQVQLLGGAGEAQVPGHGLETLQGGDRGQVAFVQHGRSFSCLSVRSMNKRNDISRKGRLLPRHCDATTKGLPGREKASAHIQFFA